MSRAFSLFLCTLIPLLLAGCVADPASESETGTEISEDAAKEPPVEVVEKTPAKPTPPPYTVMGWLEHVKVSDVENPLKAKLDSGATTSSIDAKIVRVFEQDEQEHVVFRVRTHSDGEEENYVTFESPIERWVNIKKKAGGSIRRPVVKMTMCIGGILINDEVNLSEREHFLYPVLIGRNMMAHRIAVDPGVKYTSIPDCGN